MRTCCRRFAALSGNSRASGCSGTAATEYRGVPLRGRDLPQARLGRRDLRLVSAGTSRRTRRDAIADRYDVVRPGPTPVAHIRQVTPGNHRAELARSGRAQIDAHAGALARDVPLRLIRRAALMNAAARSATIITAGWMLDEGTSGKTEASATRSPSMPRRRSAGPHARFGPSPPCRRDGRPCPPWRGCSRASRRRSRRRGRASSSSISAGEGRSRRCAGRAARPEHDAQSCGWSR